MKYRFIFTSIIFVLLLSVVIHADSPDPVLFSGGNDPGFLALLFFFTSSTALPFFSAGGGQNGS